MALYKIVHIFKSSIPGRAAGWTDVWYVNAGSVQLADQQGFAIANSRIKGLHQDFTLDAQRTSSNVPTLPKPAARRGRASSLSELNLDGSLGPAANADLPGSAALIRVSDATNTVFKNWLLRGTPDNWWDNDQDKIASAQCKAFLMGFIPVLVAQQAFILHKNGNPAVYTPVAIQQGNFFRLSHRNTGRPFFLQRGRR